MSSNESSIIGGQETAAYPGIIAIYGKKPGENKGSLCTATVITPTHLLTAAHCVDPAVVGQGLVFKALLGPKLTDQANPPTVVDIESYVWHPGFSAQQLMNGNDIAVVKLARPVPEGTPTYKFNRGPLSGITKARLVGYGLNNAQQQTGAGIKRTAEVPVAEINDKFVVTGSWFGTTMCSGDSGGPVLANINGEDVVVGVNSFGFIQCMGTGSSTRVDSYLSWVDQYIPQAP